MDGWFDGLTRLTSLNLEKGGYNKTDALTKLDTLHAVLMIAESGNASREQLIEALKNAESVELRREKGGFFGKYGFSVSETDACIAEVTAKIKEKIR